MAKREAAAAVAVEQQAKEAVEGKDFGRGGEIGLAAASSCGKNRCPISYKFIHREVERQKLFNSVSLSDGDRELMTRQFLAGVHHGDIKVRMGSDIPYRFVLAVDPLLEPITSSYLCDPNPV